MMSKKWSLLEQGQFLKKTGELLARGYSYSEAVESLLYQLPVCRHHELEIGLEKLKSGQPLYTVFADLKFQKDLIGYIYFANKHGDMIEALSEGSKMILNKNSNYQKLRKALFYPIFLFMMTIILFFFVQKTLLPQYFNLYDSMDLKMNVFTKIIAATGTLLPQISIYFLIFHVILLLSYFLFFTKLPILKQRLILLKMPVLGKLLRLIQTQYFSLQLGYLLSGGLSVYEALQLFESAPRNVFYKNIGKVITEKLKQGSNLPEIIMNMNVFEKELPIVLLHGQSNGKIDKELLFFSQNCLMKLEEKIEKGIKLLQPILYGVVGILVVSMYLSVMLPMFRMLDGL
ncbi:competence type IV pilus assembly protein ComGB [Neobacillus sp. D3-1R]|uniref:competence type IV pilus assembly protein ComGB n=1 Tax=Neobacillus sp. D3-1R TaxID=3445778 RepID=UPI003FA0785B